MGLDAKKEGRGLHSPALWALLGYSANGCSYNLIRTGR